MNTSKDQTAAALKASRENPGCYVTVERHGFGVKVHVANRLDREAPSHSLLPFYVLNGTRRPFTEAQRVADQNAGTFRGC